MKTFIEICKMEQKELKSYLKKYLKSKKYKVIEEDGFLYAPAKNSNKIPVLLVAHMDTVHKERIKEVCQVPATKKGNDEEIFTMISSPQGIGGDDRCGIYMIMNLIKNNNVSVLFCEDEEKGCIGAKKFAATEYCKNLGNEIKYMIELDRMSNNDAVFYECDNPEFTDWIEQETDYVNSWGSFTDICKIMPVAKVAGVNLSCGYYNQHTTKEYVLLEEMEHTIEVVDKLLKKEIPQKFEFIEKKYTYGNYGSYGSYGGYYGYGSYKGNWYEDDDDQDYYWNKFNNDYNKKQITKNQNSNRAKRDVGDLEVTLVVCVNEDMYGITSLTSTGATKPECWMNLFMDNPDFSYQYVDDYWYE